MTTRTAVSSVSFSKSAALLAELRDSDFEPTPNLAGRVLAGMELGRFLDGHEAAVVGTEVVDASVLDLCPTLRYLAKYGVGLDNLDLGELRKRGIAVGVVPGVNKRAVAELTLGFMIGHCRNIFRTSSDMKKGLWIKDGGRDLSTAVVGIVGFGNIGTEVTKLLASFGTTVQFTDVVDKSVEGLRLGAKQVPYDDLLASSDIISFHVPGTPATSNMFDAGAIRRTNRHALVINTSRGKVVDFDAVTASVIAGDLGGYAADVFVVEPVDLSRFRDQPTLYFTPHIAGNSRDAVLAMGRASIAQLRALRKEIAENQGIE